MNMAVSKIVRAAPQPKRVQIPDKATFLALNEKFPLASIHTETQSEAAVEMVRYLEKQFLARKMPRAVREYLDTLLVLIEEYQQKHFRLPERVSPPAFLKALLEMEGLQQSDLVPGCFSQKSLVSEFLAGKRPATWAQAKALGKRFNVDPVLFMDR